MRRAAGLLLCAGCNVVFPLRDRDAPPGGDAPSVMGTRCDDDDLLACFDFDGNVSDGSGRTSLVPKNVEFVDGVEGSAVSVGPNSRLDFTTPATLTTGEAQTELTIETWIFVDSPALTEQIVIDYDTCWAMALSPTRQVRCYDRNGATTTTMSIDAGTWTHIACTQVDDLVTIFINGAPALESTSREPRFDGCMLAAIGVDAPEGQINLPLTGRLDRFRLLNRLPRQGELESEAALFAKQ